MNKQKVCFVEYLVTKLKRFLKLKPDYPLTQGQKSRGFFFNEIINDAFFSYKPI